MKNLIIFGAGAHAKVLIDCIEEEAKFNINRLFDDNPILSTLFSYPVSKINTYISSADDHSIIAITNGKIRKKIAESLNTSFVTTVHPTAVVSKYATIGKGTHILAGSIINAAAVVGNHCIINTGTVVEHDCIIGDYVHLSPNTSIGGGVKIGECTHIGIGASVIQNISIGSNVIIGAGAVVVSDIPDNCTAVGIPAKPIKFHEPNCS